MRRCASNPKMTTRSSAHGSCSEVRRGVEFRLDQDCRTFRRTRRKEPIGLQPFEKEADVEVTVQDYVNAPPAARHGTEMEGSRCLRDDVRRRAPFCARRVVAAPRPDRDREDARLGHAHGGGLARRWLVDLPFEPEAFRNAVFTGRIGAHLTCSRQTMPCSMIFLFVMRRPSREVQGGKPMARGAVGSGPD